MLRKFLIPFLIFAIASIWVTALDDQGNPNDPTVNPRANSCYEDGSMADQCDTDIEWEAGWYLIRYEYGLLSEDDFPHYFAWVLPNRPDGDLATRFDTGVDNMSGVPPVVGVCPSLSFTCGMLFTCGEAQACYDAGNLSLDGDSDGKPCNEGVAPLCS